MSYIELEHVKYRAGEFVLVMHLQLSARVTGIFGPSGAGKTTLIEIIAGLRKPQSGRVILNGEPVSDGKAGLWLTPDKRRIGYVPQDLALFPHLNVRENLLYGAQKDSNDFSSVTSKLRLDGLLNRPIKDLSGGEKQRVAIGRALMSKPSLLILDEPLSNLDHDLKARGFELISQIIADFKTPLLYVTHDANELVGLCDKVLVMNAGRSVVYEDPQKLFSISNKQHYTFIST